ncbi:MAG: hypothetical protein ACFE95_16995 [Candidatus Hodarchaeota archaeon]
MQDEIQFMPSLIKSALNYGKRYISRTLSEILREWSLDEFIEDSWIKGN